MCQPLFKVLYVYKLIKLSQQPIRQILLCVCVCRFTDDETEALRCRDFKVTTYVMEPDFQPMQPDSRVGTFKYTFVQQTYIEHLLYLNHYA